MYLSIKSKLKCPACVLMNLAKKINKQYVYAFANPEERAMWILDFFKKKEVQSIEISQTGEDATDVISTPKKKFICNVTGKKDVKILTENEVKNILKTEKHLTICSMAITPEKEKNICITIKGTENKATLSAYSNHTIEYLDKMLN